LAPDLSWSRASQEPIPLQSVAKATVTLRAPGFVGKTVPLRVLKDGKVLVEKRVNASERQQSIWSLFPMEPDSDYKSRFLSSGGTASG